MSECDYTLYEGAEHQARLQQATALIGRIRSSLGQLDARASTGLDARGRAEILAALDLISSIRVPLRFGRPVTSCGMARGRFDPQSGAAGTIVLYSSTEAMGDFSGYLIHEGIHALHFQRHHGLRDSMRWVHDYNYLYCMVNTGHGAQRTRSREALIGLAFTEYWAYRRQQEYQELSLRSGMPIDRRARSEIGRYLQLLQTHFSLQFNPQVSPDYSFARQNGIQPSGDNQ